MERSDVDISDIDKYISGFDLEVGERLRKIRAVIKRCALNASEKMSYGVPAFYLKGNLILYAAFKTHIGIYPSPETILAFQDQLEGYKTSKGTIKFPHNKPFPYELLRRIVLSRVEEKEMS